MTIVIDSQSAAPGQLITLYELDLTSFQNGTYLRFTSTAYNSSQVLWSGNVYTAVEVDATGFDYDSQSAFPTPTLRLSNVTQLASALVIGYGDLIGAPVKRIRTYSTYLDDGPSPDPAQIYVPDLFQIEQKTKHTRTEIEWKLSASIDQQGIQIPNFLMVRDYCARIFRRYNTTTNSIDYSQATCPYTGPYYDINNNSTSDPTQDACPKTLVGCTIRFGANSPLPFKGCPGLAKFQ